ncbi:unnamed protein product [Parnassius apollo]|uniref:(apollo) hypothetical protein n=1 Tax=Parnassius apollo TaxID=110799 RepID=A0A8S3WI63_PARAO|nr:unnamed protein product [Parnassius apollo]
MLKDNVLEYLFYRFNPYFPERDLPVYEINPADPQDINVKLGLCHTLLDQKSPPVQKSQIIISLCLSLLTDALEVNARISCCVYPEIEWPSSVNTLATRMLDVALNSLKKHLILSDRFLISLLNFIWEAIIWNDKYRGMFVMDNGVYKLLDLITLTRPPIQCLALALLCDVARAGEAVAQMITWRASPAASDIHPILVRRGATIATLLAAIFRDECYIKKVNLSSDGVLQDLNYPLMSPEIREELKSYDVSQEPSTRVPESLAASDLAGSRMSKTILVLCSHYLTFKLNETWIETKTQCPGLLSQDNDILEEFLHIAKGWAKEVQQLQEGIIKKSKEKEYASECSLYEFLSRVRLNIALDALREIRCMARSTDHFQISHALLHDAVWEQQRRAELSKNLQAPIIKTYTAPLDVQVL